MSCPHCLEDAKFMGYRCCERICLFGRVVYERAYHASEHLLDFAKVLHKNEDARQQQTAAWCHQLKHTGGASLLSDIESLGPGRSLAGCA